MKPLSLIEWALSIAAGLSALRLFQLGSLRKQSALFSFLVFTSAYSAAQATADPHSARYFWIYVFGSVLDSIVRICAVREMFALTFVRYPGIRAGGRWLMYGMTALGVGGALVLTLIANRTAPPGSIHLYYLEILNRSVMFTLAIVVMAILLFLSRYPLHLSHNTYVSTGFFSALFLSDALVLLFDSMNTLLYSKALDIAQAVFAALCFAGWAIMLRPETEAVPAQRVVFESPEEHELLEQLDSLNRLMGRVGRW